MERHQIVVNITGRQQEGRSEQDECECVFDHIHHDVTVIFLTLLGAMIGLQSPVIKVQAVDLFFEKI